MLARNPSRCAGFRQVGDLASAALVALGLALGAASLSACGAGHGGAPAMCARACDDGFACVAGGCLRNATTPELEAVDKYGLYKARRLVLAPTDAVYLAAGDTAPKGGETARVATLGRARDAGSVVLLRFALDVPPEATILGAYVVLDRAPAIDADPSPIALHAARIVQAWDAQSVSWGRAPFLSDARSPVTTVDDARTSVRLDVRILVQRWRAHARDDHGIAIVADRSSASGVAFTLADGAGASEERALALPVRSLRDTPPTFHSTAEAGEPSGETLPPLSPRGPRLEVYLRP
jgi:hypothetical protein